MDICVWGDSITYGSSDSEGLGWVGRLRKTRTPEKDDDATYERGICGDTSQGLLKRFANEFDALVYKPELVMFATGMNDCSRRGPKKELLVPLSKFKDNLKKLVRLAKKRVRRVYVVGITNVDEGRTNPLPASRSGKSFSNQDIQEYNKVLKEVAEQEEVPFLDVFGILSNTDLADGLHPNASGYQKMFEALSPRIQ